MQSVFSVFIVLTDTQFINMDIDVNRTNSSSNIIYGKYEIIKHLGRGSFADVFLVRYKGQLCAMKQIRMKDYNNRETLALKNLNHKNIVKLIEVDQRTKNVLIILEYCNSGTIKSFQQKLQQKRYSQQQAIEAIYQVFCAVQFIHKNGFMHRDIKPQNILVHQAEDFGLSTIDKLAMTGLGTPYFSAPQLLECQSSYDNSVDIWSTGVTLFYMITGKQPFTGKLPFNILEDIQKQQPFDFKKFKNTSNIDLIDFFKRIFQIDPKKRITISEIFNHPLFSKYRNSLKNSQCHLQMIIGTSDYINKLKKNASQKCISYLQESQKNNILIYIIDDLRNSEQHFNDNQLKALIYNVLKLYIVYQSRLFSQIIQKQSKNYKLSQQQIHLATILKSQIHKACQKYISYYQKCNQSREDIAKAFLVQPSEIFIQKQISEKQFTGLFKSFYRLTTMNCYQNIKKLTQSGQKQQRLQHKIFILHSFNKIFEHGRIVIDEYYQYIQPQPLLKSELFNNWLNIENIQKINLVVQRLKKKWFIG